jgi:predicted ArsR family transcriptional regulator
VELLETLAAELEGDGWTVDRRVLADLEHDLKVDDPEAFSALLNSFRIRLVTSLARRPASVKELAERFEVPTTRLYHHLDQLQKCSAVRVVATRRSGARTERCYGAVRSGIGLDPQLLTRHPDQVADAMSKMVTLAGEIMGEAIRSGRLTLGDPETSGGFLSWQAPQLTAEQRREIGQELEGIARRIGELSEANQADGVADAEPTVLLMLATPDPTVPT